MLRFHSLDGWRGVAALLVSLYHLNFFNHLHDWDFLRNSYLFVDFFFVLSGFVITHAYKDKLKNTIDFKKFISRRLSRLLPLHLFVLALFILFELLKLFIAQFGMWTSADLPFTGAYTIQSIFSNLFLIHSLGIHDHLSWNYPSWSISVEFYTYIIFAVVGLIGYKSRKLLRLQYSLLIVLSFYIIYINTDHLNDATYHYGIFRCIIGFFLGSICYRFFLLNKNKVIPYATVIEIFSIIVIYFFTAYFGKEKLSIIAPIIFTFTVYIFAFEQGLLSKLLKVKPIQNLGKWSYSIYMIHAFIILIIGRSINFFENITGHSYFNKYMIGGEETELVYFYSPYLMDFLTVIFLVILVYISSFTYKNIELRMSNFTLFK